MTLADPLYEIPVKCPVCYTDPVMSYKLKSKCQTITVDELTIPSYKGIRGHADADLLEMAATVCPRCLYASTLTENFTRMGGLTGPQEVVLRDHIQQDLLLGFATRSTIIEQLGLTSSDFARSRSPKAAYASYQLTAWSAAVKAQHRFPRALSELAGAHLYSWHFARRALAPEVAAEALAKAAKAYAQVFQSGDHDVKNADQVLYLCIALHLELGWREEAKPFLVAFDRLRERSAGSEHAQRLRVYYDRIVDLWQTAASAAEEEDAIANGWR